MYLPIQLGATLVGNGPAQAWQLAHVPTMPGVSDNTGFGNPARCSSLVIDVVWTRHHRKCYIRRLSLAWADVQTLKALTVLPTSKPSSLLELLAPIQFRPKLY